MFCPLELEGFSMKTDQPRWGCYGWVPLKQGRLVSLANPALPTDQPRWGCLHTVFPIGDKYDFDIWQMTSRCMRSTIPMHNKWPPDVQECFTMYEKSPLLV